jgi:hypothetical protein
MTQAYAMQYAKNNANKNHEKHSLATSEKHSAVTGEKAEPDFFLFLFMVVFFTYTVFLLIRGLLKK